MTHSEEPQQIAHTIQKPTGTMPTKTRKREYPKKAEGTSPSFSKRPKGRRLCSVSGCTKWVQQGGACWRHGGRNIRAKCSYVDKEEGRCQNVVKRGGLCRVSTANMSSHLCIFYSLCSGFVVTTEARSIQPPILRQHWMQEGSQAATTGFL